MERQDEDVLKLEARRVVVRNEKEVERYLRISREAASLLFWGHINKAIRDSTQTMWPERTVWRPLPYNEKKSDPIPSLGWLMEARIRMKGAVSPGCCGLRHEYLFLLGEKLGNHGISTTEEFIMNYLRGQ